MTDGECYPTLVNHAAQLGLPQTDRATRYVSRNLVNSRNKLYNKSATNRSNGVGALQLIDL